MERRRGRRLATRIQLNKNNTREESMKAALRLIVFTMSFVLLGEAFAEGPVNKPETVGISPDRLSQIRAVLQKEVDADGPPRWSRLTPVQSSRSWG